MRAHPLRILVLTLSLAASGCASTTKVDRKPPAPKVEEQPLKPSSDVIWQDGHWSYDTSGDMFFWETGTWAAPQRGKIWIAGFWRAVEEDGGRRWEWVPERWEDLPE